MTDRAILADTHSHMYDGAFDADRAAALDRAAAAGVGSIYLPAIDSSSHDALFSLVRERPGVCRPMMGLHPTSVNGNPAWERELELVEKYLGSPPPGVAGFCAVGEVGLDLHWSREWIREQTVALERQIELALAHGLPVAVHTREAWSEMIAVLRRYRGRGLRGVMHAFSGGWDEWTAVRDCGDFVIGVGGVVTYKNNRLVDLLPRLSPDDIVLESDAPWLAPVPFRGERNESAYVAYVCEKVAEMTGRGMDDVARTTMRNARRMFGRGDHSA